MAADLMRRFAARAALRIASGHEGGERPEAAKHMSTSVTVRFVVVHPKGHVGHWHGAWGSGHVGGHNRAKLSVGFRCGAPGSSTV